MRSNVHGRGDLWVFQLASVLIREVFGLRNLRLLCKQSEDCQELLCLDRLLRADPQVARPVLVRSRAFGRQAHFLLGPEDLREHRDDKLFVKAAKVLRTSPLDAQPLHAARSVHCEL